MAEVNSPGASSLRLWHRLFGILLTDHLTGTPFQVETEVDLSLQQQLLDIVVIRRGPGEIDRPLPDGLNDLVDHNLITFKSHHEPLDDWALKELTGYYVAYRKQVSPRGKLLAEDRFRLYAVCARRPRDLFAAFPPQPSEPGVYTCRRGSDAIRIVVARELDQVERNAMLHLFSAAPKKVQYGREHCEPLSPTTSTVIYQLFGMYKKEGLKVPYTLEDFKRDFILEHVRELPAQKIVEQFTPEERLAGIPPEERLAGLSDEQIKAYLNRQRKKSADPKKKKPKRS